MRLLHKTPEVLLFIEIKTPIDNLAPEKKEQKNEIT